MPRLRRLMFLLCALLLFAPVTPIAQAAEATQSVTIQVDGRPIQFPDAQPGFANSRLLVPVRFVSEALGADVEWEEASRTVRIEQGDRFIRLYLAEGCGPDDCNGPTLAEQRARLACLAPDCTSAALLDVAPRIVQGRTYIPLRFVAEALGAQVTWDEPTRTANLLPGQGPGLSSSTQIEGLPSSGLIDRSTSLSVSGPAGSLIHLYAIEPNSRQGYLLSASSSTTTPITIGSHALPPGDYLLAAGIWTTDRWSYSLPQRVTFTGEGKPWGSEQRAWLAGYPEHRTYRYQAEIYAQATFTYSQITWLLDGEPQPEKELTFVRALTPADNRTYTLQALLQPTDGGPAIATEKVEFHVEASPIQIQNLGRDRVITSELPVWVTATQPFTRVEYRISNGRGTVLQRQQVPADQPYPLNPATLGEGAYTLSATGYRADGSTADAASLPFYAWPGGEPVQYAAATPDEQQAFLAQYQPIALAIYAQTGLSPSLQLAQAILESGWGKAEPRDLATGARSYNLFGVKAISEEDPSVRSLTQEFMDGETHLILSRFKRFTHEQEAWQARANYLLRNGPFAAVRTVPANPEAVIAILQEFGYATDPQYAKQLQRLLNEELLANGQPLRSLDRIQF